MRKECSAGVNELRKGLPGAKAKFPERSAISLMGRTKHDFSARERRQRCRETPDPVLIYDVSRTIGSDKALNDPRNANPGSADNRSVVSSRESKTFEAPHCRATVQRYPCRSCDQPLPGREGKFVLKYFLLRNAGRVWRRSSALPVPGTDISSPVK
jgi:hypothetical protein